MSAPKTPERRSGPVPLVLHMAMARAQYASAQAALSALLCAEDTLATYDQNLIDWKARYADLEPRALTAAMSQYCEARLKGFLRGIEHYQTASFKRPQTTAQAVYQVGSCTLLDHGGDGPPVLLVPSLINPGWVLDLLPGVSFADYIASQGFRVFRISWGTPGDAERDFRVADYVLKRLVPAMQHMVSGFGPLHLVGYCLGGNIALAAALAEPSLVRSFCAIATPWDFDAMGEAAKHVVAQTLVQLDPILRKTGLMPADALQALFAQLDPTQIERKFYDFSLLDETNPAHQKRIEHFITVEDWSNEGPALVHGVVEECFAGFYGRNDTARGRWRIGDKVVDPSAVRCPSMVLAAGKDRIVPPASTLALGAQLPGAHVISPHAGHVGMMVGSKAQQECWQPVTQWLHSLGTF